jgi:hypothetical protein
VEVTQAVSEDRAPAEVVVQFPEVHISATAAQTVIMRADAVQLFDDYIREIIAVYRVCDTPYPSCQRQR